MNRGNLTILKAEVRSIDVAARTATLERGDAIVWDHLIVAAGATHSYFGHDDWAALRAGAEDACRRLPSARG
jgi:NADH dehydrogenase